MIEPRVSVANHTDPTSGRMNPPSALTVIVLGALALASLAAILFLGYSLFFNKPDEAKWSKAQTDMSEIGKAVNLYSIQHGGNFPPNLAVLRRAFPDGVPEDPFTEEPFIYAVDGDDFTITCLGMDHRKGGNESPDKDIVVNSAGLAD